MTNFIYAGSLYRTSRSATAALIFDYFSATGSNSDDETLSGFLASDANQHCAEGAYRNAGAALRAEIDRDWPLNNDDDEECGLAFSDALDEARVQHQGDRPAFFA